jgi:hypothetical protein
VVGVYPEHLEQLLRAQLNCRELMAYLADILYESHYCEENVYQLARRFVASSDSCDKLGYVVFISNAIKAVPIWQQKLCDSDEPVVWDYHVIFVAKDKAAKCAVVVDQDSKLGYPVDFTTYALKSFMPQKVLQPKYRQ